MIDIHNHIVPAVDDGAKNLDVSLSMLREGLKQQIDGYVFTPHYNRGKYENETVLKQYQLLKDLIIKEGLPITTAIGNELYLNEDNVSDMIGKKAYTLGDSQYVLVELPFTQFYPFHETLLYKLQLAGFKIVLAHIERYDYLVRHTNKLDDLLGRGILGQLSCKCILDSRTQKLAFDWIEKGYVQVVASDAHNITSRPVNSLKAYNIIVRQYGATVAETLFTTNPQLIIDDAPVIKETYKRQAFLKRVVDTLNRAGYTKN